MVAKGSSLVPFKIAVSDDCLNDLRHRILNTRWDPDLNNEDEFYGISTRYLRDLANYWADGFDWREREAEINRFEQYKANVDGNPVHFIWKRGKGPRPTPIILSHGWPWSFWDWKHVIDPLTDPVAHGGSPDDAFDVIVPSLPGFGFSTPASRGDLNFWKMADILNTLMTDVLGYEKYAAGGSDYGALVTAQLGHKYSSNLVGIHLGHSMTLDIFQTEKFWDITDIATDADGLEKPPIDHAFARNYASHVAVHMLDAQTITHALNDSPVGMLAWIMRRWQKWSDPRVPFEEVWTRNHLLTNAMIFWVNQAIGSSIRAYRNCQRYPWKPSHSEWPVVPAPAGFTFLTGDSSPPGANIENRVELFRNSPIAKWYNVVYAKAHDQGGHFTPLENPTATVSDIRATFRAIKALS